MAGSARPRQVGQARAELEGDGERDALARREREAEQRHGSQGEPEAREAADERRGEDCGGDRDQGCRFSHR